MVRTDMKDAVTNVADVLFVQYPSTQSAFCKRWVVYQVISSRKMDAASVSHSFRHAKHLGLSNKQMMTVETLAAMVVEV